ncbi:putative bifunctional diguanylate cyclase/phosphodiesterase [Nucisporomicrobium flavum]|uniref:putative bifunctional diguanylate cyclase/phosphodiesterase n=1 Tax=Nucisporomicrobium flavum TaxID=2785915 RepID=UPI0018F38453|nr:bifunctional diguanylate cyclase/phosphodiesterase [Nucisporomicrobium flavum]
MTILQRARSGLLDAVRAGDAWWWFLLGGTPLLIAGAWLGPAAQEAAYAVLAALAGAGVLTGLAVHRPARTTGWWLVAAAMTCGSASSAAWSLAFLDGSPPGGLTVVDAVYFAMYLLVAAALAAVASRGASALAGMVEAGVVACTAIVLGWVFLIDPFVNDNGGWTSGSTAVAYPLLDLFILTMAVRLAVAAGGLTRTHVLMLLAVATMVASDIVYFVSVSSGGAWSGPGVSVSGWMLFYLLLGAAALHPSMAARTADRSGQEVRSSRRVTALYTALVAIGPLATAYACRRDLRAGDFDLADVALPLAATAATAVLLVIRLSHTSALVNRRAAELEQSLAEQAVLQERMSHLALHDALTGLPNRLHVERSLDEALRRPDPGTLLMIDLDGFQQVNDSFGHPTGDALLQAVAGRLTEAVGTEGVLARLGGDEFAVLLPGVGHAEAAAAVQELLAALRRPVAVLGHRLHVTASIGVRNLASASGSAEVLSDADMALNAAKRAGRDRAEAYDVRLRESQLRRIATVERLRGAIGTGDIVVHYQPIVSLTTGRFTAVEALVRWCPPGAAPIMPDDFIPAAEDSGLIVPLGEQVLRDACRDAAGWHARYGIGVTVNVSPRQLAEPHFAAKVRAALSDSGLPAAALILEITEGMLIGAGPHARQSIAHLADLRHDGVRVAVDDFGTGYSSLAYLRDLPIDILKIDRSFMPAGDDAGEQVALVRTIVGLAHDLRLATVAEGVETLEQAAVLQTLGCDKGQGWHYGRPAPADRTTALFAGEELQPVTASRESLAHRRS